jgi:hypothetical protein
MRRIPDPGHAGDDGRADPEVREALEAYASAPETAGTHARALAALQHTRLLVPVVAVLGDAQVGDDGLARDKSSDMATVLMRGRDGRTALLAFTGTDALTRWDPQARPVPVAAPQAAEAAVHDGAAALLVDVAGPYPLVVEEMDLRSLAEGYTLMELSGRHAWVIPDR